MSGSIADLSGLATTSLPPSLPLSRSLDFPPLHPASYISLGSLQLNYDRPAFRRFMSVFSSRAVYELPPRASSVHIAPAAHELAVLARGRVVRGKRVLYLVTAASDRLGHACACPNLEASAECTLGGPDSDVMLWSEDSREDGGRERVDEVVDEGMREGNEDQNRIGERCRVVSVRHGWDGTHAAAHGAGAQQDGGQDDTVTTTRVRVCRQEECPGLGDSTSGSGSRPGQSRLRQGRAGKRWTVEPVDVIREPDGDGRRGNVGSSANETRSYGEADRRNLLISVAQQWLGASHLLIPGYRGRVHASCTRMCEESACIPPCTNAFAFVLELTPSFLCTRAPTGHERHVYYVFVGAQALQDLMQTRDERDAHCPGPKDDGYAAGGGAGGAQQATKEDANELEDACWLRRYV